MSWLLFLDESGHDHRNTPYEVRGGVALRDSKLWPFMQALRSLEQSAFGTTLNEHGTKIKGSKLLGKDRFKFALQAPPFDDEPRRKHTLNFLNNSRQKRTPRKDEFTAFGQASLLFVEQSIELLLDHDARLFASMIPCASRPPSSDGSRLRKDIVFLLERFFYFLEDQRESGLLVMDQTDKSQDRNLVRQFDEYFTGTAKGRHRTTWIVPVPLFVDSDMAGGVQMADLAVYILNWGYRLPQMTGTARPEIQDFSKRLTPLIWHGRRSDGNKVFRTQSVVYVPDPYTPR